MIWLLSTVVVGLISWQYAEIQRNNTEAIAREQSLRKAKIELQLILQDIRFASESRESLTLFQLSDTLRKMQYNALKTENELYVPSLQNIMLEIDSRSKSNGLLLFQKEIFEHLSTLSVAIQRIGKPYHLPNQQIWLMLEPSEKEYLASLHDLTKRIMDFYNEM